MRAYCIPSTVLNHLNTKQLVFPAVFIIIGELSTFYSLKLL